MRKDAAISQLYIVKRHQGTAGSKSVYHDSHHVQDQQPHLQLGRKQGHESNREGTFVRRETCGTGENDQLHKRT